MSTFRKVLWWIYSLQLFLVLPWFLGAIYRHEQSMWAWREFSVSLHRHGLGDALLLVYLYVLFYSAFFVIPFCILSASFRPELHHNPEIARIDCLFLSGWFAATAFLFADSFMEFIRHIPIEDWRCFLIIVWAICSVVAFQSLRKLKSHSGIARAEHK
ncbi:MAG: hypothetical protein JWM68_5208 [Verrucomicrobiales bacterium]|nr:hypothetical protein [Verrucomicrobiales bacterium]